MYVTPPADTHFYLTLQGTQVRRWQMSLEFTDAVGNSVANGTREIDWTRPRFYLSGHALRFLDLPGGRRMPSVNGIRSPYGLHDA